MCTCRNNRVEKLYGALLVRPAMLEPGLDYLWGAGPFQTLANSNAYRRMGLAACFRHGMFIQSRYKDESARLFDGLTDIWRSPW